MSLAEDAAPSSAAASASVPTFREDLRACRWGRIFSAVTLLVGLCIVTNVGTFLLFDWLERLLAGTNLAEGSPLLTPGQLVKALTPMGALLLAAVSLIVEVWGLGWHNSSLRRVLFAESNSTRTDLFYLFLFVSGLVPILSFLFSLGLGYAFNLFVQRHFQLNLLADQNFFVSLAIVTFLNTFLFYWNHRLMHTRLLWQLHAVHHAAEEMNLITPHRNHPIDRAVNTFVYALPMAALGARPEVLLTYTVVNGVYQQMAHSHWDWNLHRFGLRWIEDYVLLSSTAHRLHHSVQPKHYSKNFGIWPVWDRVFGTWSDERPENLKLGVYDKSHNTGRPLRETWTIFVKFVRILRTEARRIYRRWVPKKTDGAS